MKAPKLLVTTEDPGATRHRNSPFDNWPDYTAFEARLLREDIGVQQGVYLIVTADVVEFLNSKSVAHAVRTVRDRLKESLKRAGLIGYFHLKRMSTVKNRPGCGAVKVVYDPPMVKHKVRKVNSQGAKAPSLAVDEG